MDNDESGIGHEGQSGQNRQPGEDQLLGVCHIIVGLMLDKVAGWVGRGERFAAGAGGGGFLEIVAGASGDDAADGEGDEEEEQQEDGIGVLDEMHDGEEALGGGGRMRGGCGEVEAKVEVSRRLWAGAVGSRHFGVHNHGCWWAMRCYAILPMV